jgi:hypothetical protein
VALGRALGDLPEQLLVVAIEGRSFSFGDCMDDEVSASAGQVTEDIASRMAAGGD